MNNRLNDVKKLADMLQECLPGYNIQRGDALNAVALLSQTEEWNKLRAILAERRQIKQAAVPIPAYSGHPHKDVGEIEHELCERLDAMNGAKLKDALWQVTMTVITDNGNLPNGFGPLEHGTQRDSCADTMDAIEGVLDHFGLDIRGPGDSEDEEQDADS